MRGLTVALVCALLVSAVFASNVVDLTPDNFDGYVDGSRAAFVEFYAPWCGHCKSLAPNYEIVGDTFAGSKDVVVAKVDADKHRELGSRFGVSGFPTLKFFPKGSTTPQDYKGGRTTDDIVSYINSNAGTNAKVKKAPSAVTQLTAENFDEIVLDNSKDVVVEFYASWCGHCKNFAPEYEKVGSAFSGDTDVVIAQIDADIHRSVGERYGVTGFPTIKFFPKNGKETPEDVSAERTTAAFVEYVNQKTGTARNADGSLQSTAGRSDALDEIAARFKDAENSERAPIIAEAERAVAAASGRFAQAAGFYVKAMQQVLAKGEDYIANERSRLQRMIESGALKADKVAEFAVRRNVLAAFL